MDNATQLVQKLDTLIKQSNSILVACHTGADPDALSSILALKAIFEVNYVKNPVTAIGERIPKSLSFIPGYSDAVNGSLLEVLEKDAPDLVVFADFSQPHMASKFDADAIQETIKKARIPMVIIDHHPETYKNEQAELYINLDPTSTATNIYLIFHEILGLPLAPRIADLLLYGIIADTNRFKFKYGAASQAGVLKVASSLLEKSTVSIEDIANELDRLDLGMLKIVSVFVDNIRFFQETFAYTTITEDQLAERNLDSTKLGDAAQYVANLVISSVDTAKQGAVIYPHMLEENTYTVRFRASSEHYPVNRYASALGGGGHPQSAAARVKAGSIEEAVEKVLLAIA